MVRSKNYSDIICGISSSNYVQNLKPLTDRSLRSKDSYPYVPTLGVRVSAMVGSKNYSDIICSISGSNYV